MKNGYLIIFFLMVFTLNLVAQSGKQLFDHSFVHEIHLTFTDTFFWDSLLVNYENDYSFSGSDIKWSMATAVIIDGTKLDSVGIRLKGLSSFDDASEFKKPLKLDFNEFVKGQDYDGMKKINLHNGACDPSQLRDFLAYDVLRKAGVKAPRVAHCKLYINDQYWGLYGMIEQIDKTFLKNNFSNDNGNLYKNNGWSVLEWLGDSITPYLEDIELKTNEVGAEGRDFLELVDIINNTPDSTFEQEIQKVLNVETFLKTLSVDIALNNWDSYSDNQRNWYLYHHPDTDLFEWIPWDYNLSMGGDFYYTANPYQPISSGCTTIAEFQYYRSGDLVFFLDKTASDEQAWSWDFGNGLISNLQNPIINFADLSSTTICLTAKKIEGTELCEHTRCKKIDLNFNPENCFAEAGQVAPYSSADPVFQIIARDDAFCCNTWDATCEAKYQNLLNGNDEIRELGIDYDFDMPLFAERPSKVLVYRLLKIPAFRQRFLELTCILMATNFTNARLTALINEQTALIRPAVYAEPNAFFARDFYEYDVGNGTGGGNDVNIPPLQYFLDQRIPQVFEQLITANEDCQMAFSESQWQDITINELVVSNIDSIGGFMDEAGEYDDWIELYNNTDQPINLEGYFLTDKKEQPLKWGFPKNTIIEAEDYLIVWADKDEEQTGLHTSFKLERNGESIMLSHEDGTVIDSLSYGPQSTNIALARIPNGTGEFSQQTPSFGKNNELISSIENSLILPSFTIYPNPARQQITLNFGDELFGPSSAIIIRNVFGQILMKQEKSHAKKVDIIVGNYPNGIYFVDVAINNKIVTKKLIISNLN